MKLFRVLGAMLLGCAMVATGYGQEGTINQDTPLVDAEPTITNKRICVEPGGLEATAKCPDVSEEQARACPSGICLTKETACTTLDGKSKASQREFKSNAEYKNIVGVRRGGMKVTLSAKTVCYRSRDCKCIEHDASATYGTCEPGDWKEFAIAKYDITKDPCDIQPVINGF
jgi:hypothetical protein